MESGEFSEHIRRIATGSLDESLVARIDEAVVAQAHERLEALTRFAEQNIESPASTDRLIAVIALGRVVEFARDDEVPSLASAIRDAIENERDSEVAMSMSSALVHAWARLDQAGYDEELSAASSANVGVRLAAAKSLALTTASPRSAEVTRVIELLLLDPEPAVAEWARDAVD